jgi:hypothetical protein
MAQVNPIHVQKFLKGMDYPATKDALVKTAKKEGADEEVLSALKQLPEKQFQTPADVSEALGGMEKR